MALQVVSPKISVTKITGVKNGVEQGEEHVFSRGELLPDWVPAFQQFVLTQTGMARQVGDFPDPRLHREEDQPAPVVKQEHSRQAVVNDFTVTGPAEVVPAGESRAATVELADVPDDTATKPVWEDYAVNQLGMSRNSAESLKKADLIAQVRARHAAATAGDEKLPPAFTPPATKVEK
jgi:hypothetical protein